MTFDPTTSPVDYVLLSGQQSPGIAEIKGAARTREWDRRRAYATSGSSPVFKGEPLAEFTLYLRLLSAEDFAAWHAWAPLVMRAPVDRRGSGDATTVETGLAGRSSTGIGATGAMDIWHPILEDLQIRSAVVLAVLQPLQTADGEWTIEIRFLEWRPRRPALVRPRGSEDRPQLSAAEQQIVGLTTQLQILAAIDEATP